MKVKIGDIVESEFGTGPLVAVTKEWVIHEVVNGDRVDEVAIHRENQYISVPVEFPNKPEGGLDHIELEEKQ